jgi:predicted deacylase
MPFRIGTHEVAPGTRMGVDLPVSVLSNHTPMTLPVHVLHGAKPGPTLFLSGVVHGDEILGVEIIRRVLRHASLKHLSGTVLAVPIVNAFGFLSHSRYMPDRRDLNRSFPGSDHGSLASLLADLFMREVVMRSNYGIDLHTAALHRTNLPQIRVAPGEPELIELAEAFGPPVVLVSKLRDGTLRQCARDVGVKVLLYEGGEALRFDEVAIRAGVVGILRVMKHLGMLPQSEPARSKVAPAFSFASTWLRAAEGGILRSGLNIGDHVLAGEIVAEVSDPLGGNPVEVVADAGGIIIGRTNLPIVNRGDALFHVAQMKDMETSRERVKSIGSELAQPMLDEDEII